jgi:hypothetical protein
LEGVVFGNTACVRLAGIRCTEILIVAGGDINGAPYTSVCSASVIACTRISVIAGIGEQVIDTSRSRVTTVCGTNVSIVTAICSNGATAARPIGTDVLKGTSVSIVTSNGHRDMVATGLLFTTVQGARVVIATFRGGSPEAQINGAGIVYGAQVSIITGGCIGGAYTTDRRVTGIIRADFPVIAILRGSRSAKLIHTDVSNGTFVPVIAPTIGGGMITAGFGVT